MSEALGELELAESTRTGEAEVECLLALRPPSTAASAT